MNDDELMGFGFAVGWMVGVIFAIDFLGWWYNRKSKKEEHDDTGDAGGIH